MAKKIIKQIKTTRKRVKLTYRTRKGETVLIKATKTSAKIDSS